MTNSTKNLPSLATRQVQIVISMLLRTNQTPRPQKSRQLRKPINQQRKQTQGYRINRSSITIDCAVSRRVSAKQKRKGAYNDPAQQSAAKRRAVAKKAVEFALGGEDSGVKVDVSAEGGVVADGDTPVPVPVRPPSTPKQKRAPKAGTPGTPGSQEDARSLRRSTVEYSKIREEERRREAEEATRRRRPTKVKEYVPLTQEQLLQEAKITEEKNKLSLAELVRYEEETKKYTINKPKYVDWRHQVEDGLTTVAGLLGPLSGTTQSQMYLLLRGAQQR